MNKQDLKAEIRLHCQVCLCIDRNLAPIGSYSEILSTLLIHTEILMDNISSFEICWECRESLRKALGLRKRTLQAQKLLRLAQLHSTMNLPKSLSNLKVSYKQNFDYEFSHSDMRILIDDKDIKRESPVDVYEDTNMDNGFDESPQEGVKFENTQDVKVEFTQNDIKSEADHQIQYSACDDKRTTEQPRNAVKEKGKTVATSRLRRKYKLLEFKDKDSIKALYKPILMDHAEMTMYLQKERDRPYFLNHPYKCHKCIIPYKVKSSLVRHNRKYHTKVGHLECDICGVFKSSRWRMEMHCRQHYTKYKCLLCDQECKNKRTMYFHMKYKHVDASIYECTACALRFRSGREFHNHYRQMHDTFICDYCQMACNTKWKLIRHIRNKHDTPTCNVCNITFKHWMTQRYHMRRKHLIEISEESFCVECNKQFDNIYQFRWHLSVSVKHKPITASSAKRFSCAECPKTYTKRKTLSNHYNFVHLKKSKYYCEKCDRYFLKSTPLIAHIRTVHEQRPLPKDKVCTICGRGFTTNTILRNHVRTHTGERPHECAHCPAKFTQRTAMMTHVKARHKFSDN